MSHRVRKHKWKDGILHIEDQEFITFDQAIMWAYSDPEVHGVKIYGPENVILHSGTPVPANSYAAGEGYDYPESGYSYNTYA